MNRQYYTPLLRLGSAGQSEYISTLTGPLHSVEDHSVLYTALSSAETRAIFVVAVVLQAHPRCFPSQPTPAACGGMHTLRHSEFYRISRCIRYSVRSARIPPDIATHAFCRWARIQTNLPAHRPAFAGATVLHEWHSILLSPHSAGGPIYRQMYHRIGLISVENQSTNTLQYYYVCVLQPHVYIDEHGAAKYEVGNPMIALLATAVLYILV
ncbi:hypothetical protein M422DRAFT_258744 [Sphaerobolus stellatus SS14]|uniref:Uncharacterized protein n=1 Tax=Sphaerobolus stellatus (strain SS14) TaxID=990650 RepID=A0A0C9VLV5_SPHS4|nr:hypothetical protein M422DRAFT_258744 [Sphaerobolus stellatus SS14]